MTRRAASPTALAYPDSSGRDRDAYCDPEHAALPRCRCKLLLPCNSCTATNAAEHMAKMTRAEVTMPEGTEGLNSHDVQKAATPWLKAHDACAGYKYGNPLKKTGFALRKGVPRSEWHKLAIKGGVA